jgi:hypothetical protein
MNLLDPFRKGYSCFERTETTKNKNTFLMPRIKVTDDVLGIHNYLHKLPKRIKYKLSITPSSGTGEALEKVGINLPFGCIAL